MYDVYNIREQFPMLTNDIKMQNKPLVFLDNCSTTFKPQCVIDAMNDYYTEYNSNSHRGDYDLSYQVDVMIEDARKEVAELVNADTNEVVFTDGATGALNLVAYGYGLKFLKKGDEIILSVAEHASNVLPWFRIAKLAGAVIKYVDIENGRILPENLRKVITNKTKIVSLAQVGNVLGYIADVKEFAKIAHEFGAIMVVDGAQSVPHLKVDFKDMDIDFLAFSAHKMCGPTGIGALVGRYQLLLDMDPFVSGGGMNSIFKKDGTVDYRLPPYKFEAGTQNLAGVPTFGHAIAWVYKFRNYPELEGVKRYMLDALQQIPGLRLFGVPESPEEKIPLFSFTIEGAHHEDLALILDKMGIAVRSGQMCAEPLMDRFGVTGMLRASFAPYNTQEDAEYFIKCLNKAIKMLK